MKMNLHRYKKDAFSTLIGFAILSLVTTGCLKTRAQVAGETDAVTGPVASSPAPARGPYGSYEIDEIKNEITRMTGRIDSIERQLTPEEGNNLGEIRDRLIKFEQRMDEMEKTQLEILNTLKKKETSSADPEKLFDRALAAFKANDFGGAEQIFTSYLDSKAVKKKSDATFYRAESRFEMKDYRKAIIDYSKFAENKFGKSKHNPEALFKIGTAFKELGMNDESKVFFQDLIDRYPKSNQAKAAKKKVAAKK